MARGRKTGGRAAGTQNKRTRELAELLAETMGEEWCPVVAMAKLSRDENLPVELRIRLLDSVAPYFRRKLAPIRDAGELAGGLEMLVAASISAVHALPSQPQPLPAAFDPVTGVAAVAAPKPRELAPAPAPKPTPEPPRPVRLELPPLGVQRDHDPFN
jgi:hypothetical protein